jgi:hypothetical protein
MARILHLVPDDKFTDRGIAQFEACAPGVHDFALYNRQRPGDVRYVRSLDRVRLAPVGSSVWQAMLADCRGGRYSAVILHSLPARAHAVVRAARGRAPVAVLPWGHEIYDALGLPEHLPETRRIIGSHAMRGPLVLAKRACARLRHAVLQGARWPLDPSLRALLEADVLATVIEEDYAALAIRFRGRRLPERFPFAYDCADYTRDGGLRVDGDGILLGHSATPSGNHADLLMRLYRLGVANPIVAPLNYGHAAYAEIVRGRGRDLFGARFRSLDRFLPFDEYTAEVRRCRCVVLGHLRQQGCGTAALALWLGARVFFLRGSPVHAFLAARGARVFLLEEAAAADFDSGLGPDDVAANRRVVTDEWGHEACLRKTRTLIGHLCPGIAVAA